MAGDNELREEIEKHFSDINQRIEVVASLAEIEAAFRTAMKKINEVEEEGYDELYFELKFRFFSKKVAYYHSIGEKEKEGIAARSCKKYEKKLPKKPLKIEDYFPRQVKDEEPEPSIEENEMAREEPLEEDVLPADIQALFARRAVNVRDYFDSSSLQKKVTSAYLAFMESEQQAEAEAAADALVQEKIKFKEWLMQDILSHPNPVIFFFSVNHEDEIVRSEIDAIYKRLAGLFHPDKNNDTPELHNLATSVFQKMLEIKKELKEEKDRNANYKDLCSKGNDLLECAVDVNKVIRAIESADNEAWDNLKLEKLDKSELFLLLKKDLEKLKIQYSHLAYKQYREACIVLDQSRDDNALEKQIRIRISTAKALYGANELLGAQLYVIGGHRIISRNFLVLDETCAVHLHKELEDLFSEIIKKAGRNHSQSVVHKVGEAADEIVNKAADEQEEDAQDLLINLHKERAIAVREVILSPGYQQLVFVKKVQNIHVVTQREKQSKLVKERLERTAGALIRFDRQLSEPVLDVRYREYEKYKVRNKQLTTAGLTAGALVATGGTIGLSALTYLGVASATAVSTLGLLGGAVGLGFAIGGFLSIFFAGGTAILLGVKAYKAHKQAKQIKAFNERITLLLQLYEEGDYFKFVEQLLLALDVGEPFATKDAEKLTVNLLQDTDGSLINRMIDFGFRPDGIAFFFSIFAEVVSSRRVDFSKLGLTKYSIAEADALAKDLLKCVFDNDKLRKKAEELDKKVDINQEQYDLKFLRRMKNKAFKRYYQIFEGLPESYYQDAMKKPFVIRLEEMLNFVRVNLAMLYVLENNTESDGFALDLIQEVKRNLDKTGVFSDKVERKLDILEDFVRALHIDERETFSQLTQSSAVKEDLPSDYQIDAYLAAKATMTAYIEGKVYAIKTISFVTDMVKPFETLFFMLDKHDIQGVNFFTRITKEYKNNEDVRYLINDLISSERDIDAWLEKLQSGERLCSLPYSDLWLSLGWKKEYVLEMNFYDRLRMRYQIDEHIRNWIDTLIKSESNFDTWLERLQFSRRLFSDNYLKLWSLLYKVSFRLFVLKENDSGSKGKVFINASHVNSALDPEVNMRQLDIFRPEKQFTTAILLQAEDSAYFNYLNFQIIQSKGNPSYVSLLIERAEHYTEVALAHERDFETVEALSAWQCALDDYRQALRDDKSKDTQHRRPIFFALVRCLFKLAKFKEGLGILRKHFPGDGSKDTEYRELIAQLHRKLHQFPQAAYAINRVANDNSKLFQREHSISNKLYKIFSEQTPEDFVCRYHDVRDTFDNERRHPDVKERIYQVISIDGGGVRGIIPAVMLCALEEELKAPLARYTDLFAGTSTGGLIAAGLSFPSEHGGSKYYAADLLELYVERSRDIFSVRHSISAQIWDKPRYSSKPLEKVIGEYFGKKKITDACTELLLTSVSDRNRNRTELFTRSKIRGNSHQNYSYAIALKATTAAPTFFEACVINGVKHYDGGVQLNNPAFEAKQEAERVDPKVKSGERPLSLLSLGTGEYIPEPSKPNSGQGLMFWAANIAGVATAGQGNVDRALRHDLGDRYSRWQVHMDKPIRLDAADDNSIRWLLEEGEMWVEEQRQAEENIIQGYASLLRNGLQK